MWPIRLVDIVAWGWKLLTLHSLLHLTHLWNFFLLSNSSCQAYWTALWDGSLDSAHLGHNRGHLFSIYYKGYFFIPNSRNGSISWISLYWVVVKYSLAWKDLVLRLLILYAQGQAFQSVFPTDVLSFCRLCLLCSTSESRQALRCSQCFQCLDLHGWLWPQQHPPTTIRQQNSLDSGHMSLGNTLA